MIELTHQGEIAMLRMAHGKANAMSIEFCRALTARLEELRASPARAVVITGQGRIFSAGVDLPRLVDGGTPYIREFLPVMNAMFATVFFYPKPVVAAINGHAVAGGCVLACAADRRFMGREAGRIGLTELLVGVPFPVTAMEIIRRGSAPRYFEELIFGGATYTPDDAVARGLLDEVVAPETLLDCAMTAANTLAALAPTTFTLTKRQARQLALERLRGEGERIDAEVTEIWCADETLARVKEYVARTLRKS